MSTTGKPAFRSLARAECETILARNYVGRLAYVRDARIEIVPVHYVFSAGWIYGRTSEGKRLEVTGHAWHPVAFEVDEVDEMFRWRSVVVHGGFYTIPAGDDDPAAAEWKRGVALLRSLVPATFTEDDPVAFRKILFRISVEELTGREAVPAAGSAEPRTTAMTWSKSND